MLLKMIKVTDDVVFGPYLSREFAGLFLNFEM